MKRAKRFLSVLLTLCMVLGMLPGTALAANSSIPFTDVKEADWCYEAVQYVYKNGMMNGTGDTTFSPNATTTRGMLVTILYRMEGMPSVAGEKFTDVAAGRYCTDAVAWASANGIVGGYGNGKFGPDDPITRQQMATILYRYAQYKGYDVSQSADLSKYTDAEQVSSYAKTAFAWANAEGLINGVTLTTLVPQSNATRAQVATILMRFCENVAGLAKTYTVTFDLNYTGGGTYKTVEVKSGETVSAPANPSRSGYSFSGWYTTATGGSKFDFDTEITENITLYAQWSQNSGYNSPVNPSEPDQDEPETAEAYTRGEWVQLLAEKLGMNLSANADEIDYYYADAVTSQYGIAIEIAHAYGILPEPELEDFNQDIPYFYPDEIATREFAAYTAVKAMGFDGTHSFDTSTWADLNDIVYQDEAAISIGCGFLYLDSSNRFNPSVGITEADATTIFSAIDELNDSVSVDPDEAYDNTKYAEGILKEELADISDYTVIDNDDDTYSVYLSKSEATAGISEGNVIVLPANDVYVTGIALKVTGIDDTGSELILVCVEPELHEVFTQLDFAGNGTAIVSGIVTAEGVSCEYDPNSSVDNENSELYPLDIDLGGSYKVPGSLKFTLSEKKFSDDLKVSGTVEIEIPDVTCIVDAHIGLFDTRVNEFTLSIQEKIKFNAQLKYTLAESGYELTNSLGNTRWEKGRVELGRLPIAIGTTGLSFDIVFFYNVEAKGTASITYTIVSTQGYQYKNGTSRAIFDYDDSLDFLELKGSAKAGLGIAGDICAFSLMDLIGYSVEAGVAFNASFTPHVLATDTLFCGDVTLYAYCNSGLDTETAVGKFLETVCHYTLEFEHLKNDANNPFKLKLHIENGLRVSECTFGMGGISGYVASLDSNDPIANARVKIYCGSISDRNLVRTLYTNSSGQYSIDNLTDNTYTIVVSATGYFTYEVTVTVKALEITYVENLLMVDRSGAGSSSLVEGTITDAVSGEGVSGTSYVLRTGWYNTTGDSIASGDFESDSYSMTLGVGNYTLEVSKTGYVTNHINIAVSENTCSLANVVLSPEGIDIAGDSIRIVLTWGETPRDLDSHLFGPTSNDTESVFHTYYSDKNYYEGNTLIANLDLDDVTSYGPETTTIYSLNDNGIYSFYVHDFTNLSSTDSTAMSMSGAKVQVYVGNTRIATFNIPVNNGGTVWHVFDYNAATDTIIPVNTFYYSSDSGSLTAVASLSLDDMAYDFTESMAIQMIAACAQEKE